MKLIVTLLFLLTLNSYATDIRQKVVVVDTGLNNVEAVKGYICEDGLKDFSGEGIADPHGHGTNIAGIIIRSMNIKTQCLVIIKLPLNKDGIGNYQQQTYVNAIKYAVKIQPYLINISASGELYIEEELFALSKALSQGTIVVVAAGNDNKQLEPYSCHIYPACYIMGNKRLIVVGNGRTMNTKMENTNYGSVVTAWEYGKEVYSMGYTMSGSSQAAAIRTGRILKEEVKVDEK